MPKLRSIVDALVDLGEKITGKPIEVQDKDLMVYGEDVTEVIDEITKNYEAGGGGAQKDFTLNADISWLSGQETVITDKENVAKLNEFKSLVANGEKPTLSLTLTGASSIYNIIQSSMWYAETTYGAEGDYLNMKGLGILDNIVFVNIIYGVDEDTKERIWTITLTINQ